MKSNSNYSLSSDEFTKFYFYVFGVRGRNDALTEILAATTQSITALQRSKDIKPLDVVKSLFWARHLIEEGVRLSTLRAITKQSPECINIFEVLQDTKYMSDIEKLWDDRQVFKTPNFQLRPEFDSKIMSDRVRSGRDLFRLQKPIELSLDIVTLFYQHTLDNPIISFWELRDWGIDIPNTLIFDRVEIGATRLTLESNDRFFNRLYLDMTHPDHHIIIENKDLNESITIPRSIIDLGEIIHNSFETGLVSAYTQNKEFVIIINSIIEDAYKFWNYRLYKNTKELDTIIEFVLFLRKEG